MGVAVVVSLEMGPPVLNTSVAASAVVLGSGVLEKQVLGSMVAMLGVTSQEVGGTSVAAMGVKEDV